MSAIDVRPGQVWADNDWRAAGRTLRVVSIQDGRAVCEILTNDDQTQRHLDSPVLTWNRSRDRRGKTTTISLASTCPTSTGYRLVRDAPAVAS